jgi:hypothetical protein
VWLIGKMNLDNSSGPIVILFEEPILEGRLDGFKVESIAVMSDLDNDLKVFVGTDDENYGGVLRVLPPRAGL